MWVIFLEMGVALTLLILIVWWTWPAKREDKAPQDVAPQDVAPKDVTPKDVTPK